MILDKCSKNRGSSLTKIQMISMGINKKSEGERLLEFLNSNGRDIIIRNDPAVNKAIQYAVYDGLIYQQKNTLFRNTKKGKKLVEIIYFDESVMTREKILLEKIGSRLTEEIIKKQFELWGNHNVDYKSIED